MLLSIIVLSYNRPQQIERILEKISSADSKDFNLIIKDDVSPNRERIKEIVEKHARLVKFDIRFHENTENMGYDRNLLDAFNITNSEYVFLLSDDDFIDGRKVSKLIDLLYKKEYKVYFTPYINNKKISRVNIGLYNESRIQEVIYNSILFSGLIFDRKYIIKLPKNENFLSSCIYTQVYLAVKIIYTEKNFGEGPNDLLYLGGDGENYFGKNQSANNQLELQDRKSITANLKYQKFLIKVVNEISKTTSPEVFKLFKREYERRLFAYFIKARSLGLNEVVELNKYLKNSKVNNSLYIKITIKILPIIPPIIAKNSYELLKLFFKKAG